MLGPDVQILDRMKSADFSQLTKVFDEASGAVSSGSGAWPSLAGVTTPLSGTRQSGMTANKHDKYSHDG